MAWKVYNKGDNVIKVLESYNGDLYFITEEDKESGDIFCYTRLYNMPQFAEWGYNNIKYLKSSEGYGKNMLWEVSVENWSNINTYEEGLLVENEID